MEWAFLVVGMLLVAAIWDIGRRYVDKIVTRELASRFDALEQRLGELEDLPESVADVDKRLRLVTSAVEGVKAQRSRGAWPLKA